MTQRPRFVAQLRGELFAGLESLQRRRRHRRVAVGVLGAAMVLGAGVLAYSSLTDDDDHGIDVITAAPDPPTTPAPLPDVVPSNEAPDFEPTPSVTLDEVARSSSIGLFSLWDLEADGDGAVWAVVGCGRTFRYDETMTQTLALTDLADPPMCTFERLELDSSGTLYAIDSVPGPNVDGHGEAVAVPVLTRVSLSGEEQIVHTFDNGSLRGVFEIAGTDAITAFGVRVTVVDLETGELQAEAELDGGAISMALTNDAIWVATTSRAVFALDRETLEILDRRDGSDNFKQLVSIDDAVWGIVDGEVVAVSDSGLAVPESNERFLGQQASDGRLWLVTRDALIVFSGDDGDEIARAALEPGHTPGVLEVSGRTAWLEDGTTNEIVRYELSL
jgi:hypothetical protein